VSEIEYFWHLALFFVAASENASKLSLFIGIVISVPSYVNTGLKYPINSRIASSISLLLADE
jgi:hypothetical protein